MSQYDQVQETVSFLEDRYPEPPEVGLILGSGLGALADELDDRVAIDYADIPNFPVSAVEGHAGKLVYGRLSGKRVLVMQGRVHFYEGWTLDQVTFPVRVFQLMGIETLLITNSAGGTNADWEPGNLMVITDHINLTGVNPLRGENDARFGTRFPDMSDAYAKAVRQVIEQAGAELDIALKHGVYVGMSGPCYETPAEIRMVQTIGGDAVGMSTVPECIVANHGGMRVGGISCITNMAAGILDQKLDHAEVKETAERVREAFTQLVTKTVELL